MRRGGLALVVIVIVSAFARNWSPQNQTALSAPQNTTAAVTAPANPPSAGAAGAKLPSGEFQDKLREKIRTFYSKPLPPGGMCADAEHFCVPLCDRPGIRFIIATVPDPIHSQLNHFFDSTMEAIEQGAFNEGYTFDRAIMPWPYSVESSASDTKGDAKHKSKHLKDSKSGFQVPADFFPGLMIFREGEIRLDARNGNSSEPNPQFNPLAAPLFVFVVGETPTAGINKDQFRSAVDIIRAIRKGISTAGPEFGILGPTFTGSLFSLRALLRPGDVTAGILPVYSTVMGTMTIKWFNSVIPAQVKVAVFQQDSVNALNALRTFVTDNLKYKGRDIAVLAEDETAYGSAYGRAVLTNFANNPKQYADDTITNLFFPRGISELRAQYAKEITSQAAASSGAPQPQTNLRLDLEVTGGDDSVAPYAKGQTAVNQEAVMRGIVSELQRIEAKFILLRATDPLDEMFLARYLMDNYPQARLVVPTPDLLFSRESNAPLNGVLGLNTYPLEPAPFNPQCPKFGGEEIFGASRNVALYNATSALVQELGRLRGDAIDKTPEDKGDGQRLAESPCNLGSDLWLTVVSGNEIRPVKVLRMKGPAFFPTAQPVPEDEDSTLKQRDARDPLTWVFAYLVCVAAMFFHGWFSHTDGDFDMWRTPGDPQSGNKLDRKTLVLWLGSLTLVAILVLLISPWIPITEEQRRWPGEWYWLLLWIPQLIFVPVIAGNFWSHREEHKLAVLFVIVSVGMAGMGIGYTIWIGSGMVLWQQRIIDLTSGASSAMPLLILLAAFYGWFHYTFRAEALIDRRTPRLPRGQNLPDTFYNLREEVAQKIRNSIHPWSVFWVACASVATILCIALPPIVLGRGNPPVRSLEGLFFDWVYCALLACAMAILIATLLRLVALWWRFRELLGAMDRVGLKDAVLRLKGFEWNAIWNPALSVADEEHKLILRELQLLECLLVEIGEDAGENHHELTSAIRKSMARREKIIKIISTAPLDTDLWTSLTSIPSLLVKFFDKRGDSSRPSDSEIASNIMQDYITLQEEFAGTAGLLIKSYLSELWKKSCLDPCAAQGAKPAEGSSSLSITPGISMATISISPVATSASGPRQLSTNGQRLAEDFVATVYANFLVTVLLSIRALVLTAVTVYVCIVLSTVFYPFTPAPTLMILAVALFAFGGAVILYVYEEMHRDATLSRLTSTVPGKLDAAFWSKFLSAGLVHLLALLASAFPLAGRILSSLLEPLLQALH